MRIGRAGLQFAAAGSAALGVLGMLGGADALGGKAPAQAGHSASPLLLATHEAAHRGHVLLSPDEALTAGYKEAQTSFQPREEWNAQLAVDILGPDSMPSAIFCGRANVRAPTDIPAGEEGLVEITVTPLATDEKTKAFIADVAKGRGTVSDRYVDPQNRASVKRFYAALNGADDTEVKRVITATITAKNAAIVLADGSTTEKSVTLDDAGSKLAWRIQPNEAGKPVEIDVRFHVAVAVGPQELQRDVGVVTASINTTLVKG